MALNTLPAGAFADDAITSDKINLANTFAFTGTVTGTPSDFVKVGTSGTISGVASVQFNNTVLSSDYSIYVFELSNIRGASENSFFLRVSKDNLSNDGNLTQVTFSTRNAHNSSGTSDNTTTTTGTFGATGGTSLSNSVGNATGEGLSGRITLYNHISGTNSNPRLLWDTVLDRNDGYTARYVGVTSYKDQSVINGVQFNMNSGNIDTGIINVYGVKS